MPMKGVCGSRLSHLFIFKLNLLEGQQESSMRDFLNLILAYCSTLLLRPFSLFLLEIVRLGYVLLPLGPLPTFNPFSSFL